MSAEQPTSIDIIETFTPEQKKQWEIIAPFFEDGRKITMSTFFRSGEPKEIYIDCLDENFMGTVMRGTLKEDPDSFRTPEQVQNNEDNHPAIIQAMIANGSAEINDKLCRS